ncbi:MAG: Sulphatase-modifying factor protein [Planctomycetaceae bacterium]|nr:Sulphatase-modifying factor protein [Planctomycetaceae bacterium]
MRCCGIRRNCAGWWLVALMGISCFVPGRSAAQATRRSFAGKKAGEERSDNELKMKFCWCPKGTFKMGSPKNEADRDNRNEDQVDVTLSHGFWMGKFEVTEDQCQLVIGTKPSHFKGKSLPVDQVSWDDAKKFCAKLTKLERERDELPDGWEYRLPTEAQWEYACRARTTTAYSFGDSASQLGDYAWHDGNSGLTAHEVGQKKPNHWGLCDMHGNVFEWCQDSYQTTLVGGTDPEVTKKHGSTRVFRGSNWGLAATHSRSADRYWYGSGNRCIGLGFRVALVQAKAKPD